MNVTRSNPSIAGLGCSCCDSSFGQSGMSGLGMDTYSVASWNPPSQSSYGGFFGLGRVGNDATVNRQGSAANNLATTSPDVPNPTAQAVFDAFSNDNGGAQPGVLQLYPNATADNLTFVHPPEVSWQCKANNMLSDNPLLFIGGTLALFYLMSSGAKAHRARKAAK